MYHLSKEGQKFLEINIWGYGRRKVYRRIYRSEKGIFV